MSTVITTASTKGGVGKSLITRQLGEILAARKYDVLIIDLCQNSSIATGFLEDRDQYQYSAYDWLIREAKPSQVVQSYNDHLDFIPSDERIDDFEDYVEKNMSVIKRIDALKDHIEPLRNAYDFILIDTHPSENTKLVSYSMIASDFVLIPTEVSDDSRLAAMRTADITQEFIDANYVQDYFIVPNKVTVAMSSNAEKMNSYLYAPLLEHGIKKQNFLPQIRHTSLVDRLRLEGKPLINERDNNKYVNNFLKDFDVLADKLVERVSGGKD